MSLLVSIVMCSARVNCGYGFTADCKIYADTNLEQSCQAIALQKIAECKVIDRFGNWQGYWSRCPETGHQEE